MRPFLPPPTGNSPPFVPPPPTGNSPPFVPPPGQLPTGLPPLPGSQIPGQQVIAPTVPAGLALPQGLPGPAPAINTRASSQSSAYIKAEWNLAHETLSKSFQELAGIFGRIEFLLSQLEHHLEAAGMNSGLGDCVKAGKECVDGMNALNGGVVKFNTHYQNFKSNNINNLNNLNQEGKSTLDSLENALLNATDIFKSINVGGAVPASTQATQSAQSVPTNAPIAQPPQTSPPSQYLVSQKDDTQRKIVELFSFHQAFTDGYNEVKSQKLPLIVNSQKSLNDELIPKWQSVKTDKFAINTTLSNLRNLVSKLSSGALTPTEQMLFDSEKNMAKLQLSSSIQILSDLDLNSNKFSTEFTKIEKYLSEISDDIVSLELLKVHFDQVFETIKINLQNVKLQLQRENLGQQDMQNMQGMIQQAEQSIQDLTREQLEREQSLDNAKYNYQLAKLNLDNLQSTHLDFLREASELKTIFNEASQILINN